MDSKLSSVSLSNNNNKLNNNNSQLKQQNLVQNGHISLSSFVEKINNNNNLIDNTSSSAVSNIEKKPIRLNSPIGGSAISWHWSEKEKNNIGIEVVDIIRLALVYFPDLATPLKSKLESVDVFNYDQVRSLAKKFNKISKETALTRKENSSKSSQNASKELLHQIITRCYNKAVDNEKALNKHYEAFSSQTYGETSYERMQMIIEELKPSQKDVFVDLGSGVGQLVVHMAGGTLAHRAVGIEIASLPSKFAKKLEHEFKKLMNWFGRPFQPFELLHGDFLSTEYRKLITEEASIIFINNYAFQSDLETRIKRELLSDLKDGTKIVSTKPYVPLNKQGAITDRQLNDISVITEVAEMKPCLNPCSWTSAYVPYYLHTINRTKLENYFLKLRNSSLRAKSSDTGSRRSSTPNSSSKTSTNSRESSICCVRAPSRDKSSDNNSAVGGVGRLNNNGGGENEQDYTSFGPTTRRKWTEYVNEMEQQKRRQSSCSSSNGGGGEKKTAAKAILNIKNKQQQQLNSLSSSSSTTSISNNNIPKMLKIVKNFSNVGGTQMSVNDNNSNLGGIPKLRLQQTTTIKKEEEEENIEKNIEENIEQNIEQNINKNIEQNINKIETTTTTNMFVEEEKMVVENVCDNTYVVEEETTKTPIPKIINVETISEENKNMENKNVNEQLISPRFEPISPDKISTPINNNNNISNISSIKQKTTGKRSYERKERINSFTTTTTTTKGNRGRPRKSADSSNIHHHSSPKVPRFSEDARDGMELMHQMTCAIQMGKPMDAASILADLANQKANRQLHEHQQQTQNIDEQNQQQHNSCLNKETPKTTTTHHSKHLKTFNNNNCLFPFPQLDKTSTTTTNINVCKTSIKQQQKHQNNENNNNNNCCSSKYPELNNFLDTLKNAYENFFDDFHSKHSNKNIVVKEEDKEQQQQPLPEQQNNVSTNNFTNFEQFRSILDSTPLKNLECEEMEEDEEEGGRRRVSSLGEENLTFYSAESRKRFLSTSGTSEANNNNNNVVFNNKTPVRTTTTMLQKKINNLQQTPKTTAITTTNFSFNKLQSEKQCSQQQKQSRLLELQKRVEDRRKWLLNAWSEFQTEMQLFNTDMDCLVNECQQQQQQKQEEEDSNTQQQQQQNQNFQLHQQLALHLITQQQTQQHKLIEAAQAQLAIQVQQAQQANVVAVVANALNNNNNNSSPTNNNNNVVGGIGQQQQQTATSSNAVNQVSTVTNQLDLLINEMRERYSQQLTAQHLLSQITQFGLLNTIAPQEIAALQSIASGAALNNVVHQLSPIAAAAVVLQQQQQQMSPVLSSSIPQCPPSSSLINQQQQHQQQTTSSPLNCLIPQNVTAPFVQNFLATLDNLATTENNNVNIPSSSSIVINGDCSGSIGGGGGGLNLSASLSNISGGDNNSANNSSNHSGDF
uniref:Histone-lysine N-methyltransferase, H3 lysine-79 specific n=1 Tax=Meloidogyne incognita TaxID=6306 RepID=A0A914LBQ2_MELIC